MNQTFTRPLFLLVSGILLSAPAAWAQQWIPYFGNTHFGYNLGGLDSARMPMNVRMADLNADNLPDAVVPHEGGFTVLLNQGGGYFGKPSHVRTSSTSSGDVAIGDFTLDGTPDVVVSNTGEFGGDTTLILFQGLGNGRFSAADTITVGKGPAGLAAADLDGDGHLDLAVANLGPAFYEDSTVTILLNNGTGHFGSPITLMAGPGPNKIQIADMNGDSRPDLVVANMKQQFRVIRNTTAGFIVDPAYLNPDRTNWASDGGATIATGDVDRDGDVDVLYSSSQTWNGSAGAAILRLNLGNGLLDTARTISFGGFSAGTTSMLLADIDGDTIPDLVSINSSGRTGDGYRVMQGQGDGTFGDAVIRPGGQWTCAVGVADVDHNGSQDVVTIDQYSLEMTVHMNGINGLPSQNLMTNGIPFLSGNIEVADLDNDGDLDVISSSDSRAAVSVSLAVYMNNGAGQFSAGSVIANAAVQVKARDLNGDLLPDLLFAGGTGSTGYRFSTAMNLGNGQFAAPVSHNVGVCAPEDIDAADMDNDGDMDVVASGGCYSIDGIQIAWNDGTGGAIHFDTATIYDIHGFGGTLALGEYNGDGILDIATGQGDAIVVLLSDSVGAYHTVDLDMGGQPYDILSEDLNDDGHPDLASCNYGSTVGNNYSMSVRMGTGTGTFGALQTLPAAYSPDLANVAGIACGDIDDDNDLDLMVANNATNDMSIYLNQGNGRFDNALRAGLYYGCRSPWFADFNGDGHCEVAALVSLPPSGGESALVILQGEGSGLRTGGTGRAVVGARPARPAARFALGAMPNPFSGSTRLAFTLPKAAPASLTVYNLLGQPVAVPLSGSLKDGRHEVSFKKGSLPAGAYRVRLVAGGESQTISLVIE